MRGFLFAGAAVAGLLGLGASAAQAQWGYGSHGTNYGPRYTTPSYGTYGRYSGGYSPYDSFRSSSYRPHYDYHDTSHYDYHPGSFQRHRNHFDYVPGHYDWHQSGHWDRH